jgi:hypothetical protein
MFPIKIFKENNKIFVSVEELGLFFTFSNFKISRMELNAFITIEARTDNTTLQKRFMRGSLYSQSFKTNFIKEIADLCIPKTGIKKEHLTTTAEEIFSKVIITYRELDALVDENEEIDFNNTFQYLYYPFVMERVPNLIYGKGGVGKSTFALYIGIKLTEICNGLYLDYEAEKDIWLQRVKRIRFSNNIQTPYKLFYRRAYVPLYEIVDILKEEIEQKEIKFIIVDSLGKACQGLNLIEAESASTFFNALDELKTTSLLISHIAKDNTGTPYGSVFFYNFARNIFEVDKFTDITKDTLYLTFYNTKNNYSKLAPPQFYAVNFADNKIEISQLSSLPEELRYGLDLITQITMLLKQNGAMKTKDIAKDLDVSIDTIRKTINRHKEFFVKIDDKWDLKENYPSYQDIDFEKFNEEKNEDEI